MKRLPPSMKWLPLVLAILSVQLPAQTPWGTHGYCFPPGSPQPQPQGGNPNYASYNGSAFTPKGHLHILLVCVDFENFISVGFTPPIDPWGDQTYNEVWLKDNLPTLATPINGQSRVFNSSLPIVPGSPTQQHNFSEYYYLMSGGAFEVTGDVYPQAVVVDLAAAVAANGGNTDLSLLNVVNRKAMEKIVAIDPNFDWDKYDSRTNGPAFNEDNSNTSPDGVLDFVIFMYRSNPFFGNSANGMGSPGYFSFNTPNGTYWVKNGITGSSVEPTRLFWMDYFGHEIAHQIYATGSHHMGANGIHFDKPYFSNGWGIMSGMFSQFEVANAWEKWWLGWKSPVTVTTGGSYALKDATEHGQALRVKIPNTQLDSQLPDSVCEYLWIEYHSKQNYWDNKFDYNGLRPAPGIGEQSSPGLYMYITDRELADRKSPAGASQANGMMVYHKDGNFDMKRDGTFSVPFAFGGAPQPVFSQITRKDNPFAGTNVYWGQPEDLGGIYTPGTISAAFGEWNGYWAGSNLDEVQRTVFAEKMPSGIDLATYAITGNSGDAFGVGDVIGLSGVVPVLNYPAYDNSNHQLGSIYINGIRISIMGYDAVNDLYNLDIAFDAYEVETDKRWCGNLILPNLGNKPSGTPYELTVKPNVTLLIDQSETPNRFNTGSHPETEELINPSRFTMNPQARMQIESGAQLVIDRFSRFDMEGGSTLEIENGAKVIVKSGAYFNMKTGSNLFVKGSGEVIIESDAHFVYDAGATIQLLDDASCLYIKGDWVLNDAIFTFYGDGFVRLGLPQPQFLAGNVHLNGANCGLLLEGNNGADEVLRVDAGTMLFPGFGLYSFKLQNAYVELGNGASIMIPPTGDPSFNQCPNPPLVLNNLVVDAPAGSQSEGIYIWDQSCHDLSHIAIHHAKTALSAFQIAANNSTPLKISNALLSHNETALATYNRSAHLYGVVMTENQDGWLAYATTQEGSMYACQSTLNTQTGVSYEGTAGLSIKNSGLNANETALLASGKMEVRAFCSSFDQNTTTGINMVKEASLDISYLPFNQTPQNQIRYNPLSITLSKAGQLRLPNGFNDLTPASGGMAIGGTQALPCIPANMLRSAKRNEWNGTGSVPASGTDYEITSIFPPFCNFMLLDDYPDAYSCVEGPPCTGCGGELTSLYICDNCEEIIAELKLENGDFTQDIRQLNEAILHGLSWMSAYNESNPDDVAAIRILKGVVNTSLQSPNAEEQWLLDYAYDNMLKAAYSAIAHKVVDEQHNQIQQVFSTINAKIASTPDPNLKISFQYDYAHLLSALGNRTQAKIRYAAILNESLAEDKSVAETWLCWYDNMEALESGSISHEAFADNIRGCSPDIAGRASTKPTRKPQLDYRLYPNPTQGDFFLEVTLPQSSSVKVELYDVMGQKLSQLQNPRTYGAGRHLVPISIAKMPKGIYFVKATFGERSMTEKIVLH